MTAFRSIPSIEQLTQRPALIDAASRHGREIVTRAARDAAAELRDRLGRDTSPSLTEAEAGTWLEARTLAIADSIAAPSLRRVINATGVILHTNLGRAPLADAAAARAAQIAAGYTNLEFDLAAGSRGHRHVHAERLLRELTGAEAALVVNNAAAAALLALTALARGREVIVSRGELVEIGGGFRVPEILAQSGAVLREVGTTNRTRVRDYAAAIGDRTALLLRVHPSNFQISGFTERPGLAELTELARQFSIPVVEDLGSGWLGVEDVAALAGEPSVRESVLRGVDLVLFSGDKLLGGPQAGIIVGRRAIVDSLRAHPLMRALRVDKLTYGALEATLALWAQEPSRHLLPVLRMLRATSDEIAARARAIIAALAGTAGLTADLTAGQSTIGGGSSPGSALATPALSVQLDHVSADELAARLRRHAPPVIVRIQDDRVLIDLRTVLPEEDNDVTRALQNAAATR